MAPILLAFAFPATIFYNDNTQLCQTLKIDDQKSNENQIRAANTALASYGWLGHFEKLTESEYAVTPIQMGARVYIPQLGRFLQADPIEGGTNNNYVYALDPVNFADLSGMCILQCTATISFFQPAAVVTRFQPTVSHVIAQRVYPPTVQIRLAPTIARAKAKPAAKVANHAGIKPTVNAGNITRAAQISGYPYKQGDPAEKFNYYHAGSSAVEWAAGGALAGGALACAIGGLVTIELGGVGCVAAAEVWAPVGGRAGAAAGFVLGGYNAPHADDFEWGADQIHPPW